MEKEFKERENFINLLILNCTDNPEDIGLLSGQCGIAIVIASYAAKFKKPQLEETVAFLFKNIARRAFHTADVGFASGMSGICWGLEYLSQNGLIDNCADDLCHDLDLKIMQSATVRITEFNTRSDLRDMYEYILIRIRGNRLCGKKLPFNKKYILQWRNILIENPQIFGSHAVDEFDMIVSDKSIVCVPDIRKYINPEVLKKSEGMSLRSGIAGYLVLKYL